MRKFAQCAHPDPSTIFQALLSHRANACSLSVLGNSGLRVPDPAAAAVPLGGETAEEQSVAESRQLAILRKTFSACFRK
jgi:hypothetical protein